MATHAGAIVFATKVLQKLKTCACATVSLCLLCYMGLIEAGTRSSCSVECPICCEVGLGMIEHFCCYQQSCESCFEKSFFEDFGFCCFCRSPVHMFVNIVSTCSILAEKMYQRESIADYGKFLFQTDSIISRPFLHLATAKIIIRQIANTKKKYREHWHQVIAIKLLKRLASNKNKPLVGILARSELLSFHLALAKGQVSEQERLRQLIRDTREGMGFYGKKAVINTALIRCIDSKHIVKLVDEIACQFNAQKSSHMDFMLGDEFNPQFFPEYFKLGCIIDLASQMADQTNDSEIHSTMEIFIRIQGADPSEFKNIANTIEHMSQAFGSQASIEQVREILPETLVRAKRAVSS